MDCLDNYEGDIFTQSMFAFSVIRDHAVIYNISEFSLYLPERFDFYIPNNYDLSTNDYSIRISFCNKNLTDQDVPILIIMSRK